MKNQLMSIVVLAVLALPGQGRAVEVVFPPDGTAIDRSDYLIVRLTSPEITAIEIEAQGERSGLIETAPYRQVYGDYVKLQADWLPGENRFKVYGFKGAEEVSKAEAAIFLRTDPLDFTPDTFGPFDFHVPEQEAPCSSCHNLRPDDDLMSEMDPALNPCISCHGRMLQQEYVHGPAAAFQCGSCHSAEETPTGRFGVFLEEQDLCTMCHDGIAEQLDQAKFIHGPVGAGLCTICHSPHASNNLFQLHKPINSTCLSCHDSLNDPAKVHVIRGVSGRNHPLEGRPEPARKGRDMACSSCHNPHGGNVTYFFRGDAPSKMMLCMRCHPK